MSLSVPRHGNKNLRRETRHDWNTKYAPHILIASKPKRMGTGISRTRTYSFGALIEQQLGYFLSLSFFLSLFLSLSLSL